MGLLDSMGSQPQSMQGGLLGGMQSMPQQPAMQPQGGNQNLQLAMQLAQTPTPQMAQQIIQELHKTRNPNSVQLEQLLQKIMGDPSALKQFADSAVQKFIGGQQ